MALDLSAALRDADDVGAACRIAVEALAIDGLMPSAYLERGGRLRCMALHGYWQVRDGMPPSAGVIGRTFRTGSEHICQDVSASGDYLEAAGHVAAEVCVPLRSGDRILGVVNVEAARPLSDSEIDAVRSTAALLEQRICELGGPPEESKAQRLARHATRMVATHSVDVLEQEVLLAALDIAALDSALLLRVHRGGLIEPRAALGPLSPLLLEAPREALATIVSFVETGTSCYTVAAPGDEMASGMASLRSAGAESVAAFGAQVEDGLTVLVLADRRAIDLAGEDVELLELLATHTASCMTTALALGDLRDRAATDPLTGLGHHATFHAALAASRMRTDVALLLCDIDRFKRYNDTRGHQAGDRLLVEIASVFSETVRRGDAVYRIGGDEFAALVRVADVQEAVDAGTRLCHAVRRADLGVTLSVGAAMPAGGEAADDLLARADRALYAMKAGGRDGVTLAPEPPAAQQRLPV